MLWPCPGVAFGGRDSLQLRLCFLQAPGPVRKQKALLCWFLGCLRRGLLQALYLIFVHPYQLLWAYDERWWQLPDPG